MVWASSSWKKTWQPQLFFFGARVQGPFGSVGCSPVEQSKYVCMKLRLKIRRLVRRQLFEECLHIGIVRVRTVHSAQLKAIREDTMLTFRSDGYFGFAALLKACLTYLMMG